MRLLQEDIEIFILDYGYDRLEERKRMEDRYICRLQTRQSNKGGMQGKRKWVPRVPAVPCKNTFHHQKPGRSKICQVRFRTRQNLNGV